MWSVAEFRVFFPTHVVSICLVIFADSITSQSVALFVLKYFIVSSTSNLSIALMTGWILFFLKIYYYISSCQYCLQTSAISFSNINISLLVLNCRTLKQIFKYKSFDSFFLCVPECLDKWLNSKYFATIFMNFRG